MNRKGAQYFNFVAKKQSQKKFKGIRFAAAFLPRVADPGRSAQSRQTGSDVF
jgi:hypothetical protein